VPEAKSREPEGARRESAPKLPDLAGVPEWP